MRVRMIAAVVVVLLLNIPMSARDDRYGAIAYGSHSGRYGYATDLSTRHEAERAAIRNCDSRDCEVKVWFRNNCGALAVGKRGITGWAYNTRRGEARDRALEECRNRTRECKIVVETCSR